MLNFIHSARFQALYKASLSWSQKMEATSKCLIEDITFTHWQLWLETERAMNNIFEIPISAYFPEFFPGPSLSFPKWSQWGLYNMFACAIRNDVPLNRHYVLRVWRREWVTEQSHHRLDGNIWPTALLRNRTPTHVHIITTHSLVVRKVVGMTAYIFPCVHWLYETHTPHLMKSYKFLSRHINAPPIRHLIR